MIDFPNARGANLLREILPDDHFSFPKPIELINFILQLFPKKDLTVLDFFAGSGTTLHGVMLQNEKDGGKRNCILITNNENDICEKITYPRIKKVIEGYTTKKGKQVLGLKNNQLSYYKSS